MTRAYYNERDPFAAEWLRRLIANELICAGDVDDRDVRDVRPSDLAGYAQHHFFAGLGGWSLALRLAGWPDDLPVWTGSCPCQPFSKAGRGGGFSDERHLWPHWHHLIRERRPAVIFGEQVADRDGLAWLDLVSADLEGEGYAVGAADLCAAGVEAPHIRQRLWFVADADIDGRPQASERQRSPEERHAQSRRLMGDAGRPGLPLREWKELCGAGRREEGRTTQQPGRPLWTDCNWLACRDGKYRPVEPGVFPLAHGIPGRVGLLRTYGNAIVPQVAAELIKAFLPLYLRRVA